MADNQIEALIDHWSYSSMSKLMSNPLAFKKKYVLKIYDDLDSPSAIVGKAGHKALEAYYNGKSVTEAIEVGFDYIGNISETGIDYGKTGSREQILTKYEQAIKFYFEELPSYHEILGVELEIVAEIETVDGQVLSVPAKSFSDLVTRNKLGEIEIIDHKFVSSYTDGSVDNFGKFLQAMFNYHTVKAKFGEAPKRVIYNECKISKNRDNTPQLQPYVIEFDREGIYGDFATFYSLYNACTKLISLPEMIFLPNPSDMFDGQNSFEVFRSGIIGVDRPVDVKHKIEQKKFVEKNFIPSAFDSVESKHLSNEEKIRLKLQEFAMPAEMAETHTGASVTMYTLKPSRGVSMSKLARMNDDLALALGVHSVRIEAPIRGTTLVGVEVPNQTRRVLELQQNHLHKGTLDIPLGQDVYGNIHYKSLSDMPHLLIAGATGSGKSVMLNVLLTALTEQMSPRALKLVLVDPKQVELSMFADVPHLLRPIETDSKGTVTLLKELVATMETRYSKLMESKVRNIDDYNKIAKTKMPKVAVVIDEFADLMLSGGKDKKKAVKAEITERDIFGKPIKKYKKEIEEEEPSVEQLIVKLAQKSRAVGIHLVLATQRPSADVVTGLIKANIPTKIAFQTANTINSKIILDQAGAEELTGKGDMLFADSSANSIVRLQGFYK